MQVGTGTMAMYGPMDWHLNHETLWPESRYDGERPLLDGASEDDDERPRKRAKTADTPDGVSFLLSIFNGLPPPPASEDGYTNVHALLQQGQERSTTEATATEVPTPFRLSVPQNDESVTNLVELVANPLFELLPPVPPECLLEYPEEMLSPGIPLGILTLGKNWRIDDYVVREGAKLEVLMMTQIVKGTKKRPRNDFEVIDPKKFKHIYPGLFAVCLTCTKSHRIGLDCKKLSEEQREDRRGDRKVKDITCRFCKVTHLHKTDPAFPEKYNHCVKGNQIVVLLPTLGVAVVIAKYNTTLHCWVYLNINTNILCT